MRFLKFVKKIKSKRKRTASSGYHLGSPGRILPEVNNPDHAIPHNRKTYQEVKEKCRRKEQLWEDPDFPATHSSMFYSRKPIDKIKWKRPSEIVADPSFFVCGASRFDVVQGYLGDCWLLAPVAALCQHQSLFHQVVPGDQSFKDDYCGVFRFRFWQYGKWVEVLVDDRLPTVEGKLCFQHSSQHNEFWSALLEKAYAKLVGCYEALKGGQSSEAMEDFTGGVTEVYHLREVESSFFKLMCDLSERQTLMCCSIEGKMDSRMDNGLYRGHAYTVTAVKRVQTNDGEEYELVRLRNPWGNEREWNGAWSDESDEWNMLSEEEKDAIQLTYSHDGEFWMTFDDFKKNFSKVEMCMLSPDSAGSLQTKKWQTKMFQGTWQKHLTAGGCRNFPDTFYLNPQFRATFEDPDADNDVVDNCAVYIGLIQMHRRKQKKLGVNNLTIGFAIYQLDDDINKYMENGRLSKQYFLDHKSFARSKNYFNLREVTGRFSLPPGNYVILPSTYENNKEGDFLLRMFSEKPQKAEIIDAQTEGEVNKKVEVSMEERKDFDERLKTFFDKIAGEDGMVDSFELQDVLSKVFKKEMNGKSFSLEACRSMVCMTDRDRSGHLDYEEFCELWKLLVQWKRNFIKYDKDNSSDMDASELRGALKNLGYSLSTQALSSITLRYSNRNGFVNVGDYIQICCRVKTCFESFAAYDSQRTPDLYLMTTLYT